MKNSKKIMAVVLATMLVLMAVPVFAVNAADNAYYVEEGSSGDGSEGDPFGTVEEAIWALDGKDGTVYIYGAYNMSGFKSEAWQGMVTITGATADSAITLTDNAAATFPGPVTLKNIAFTVGKYTHLNPQGAKFVFDANNEFPNMVHASAFGSVVNDEAYFVMNSGKIGTFYFGGGYSNSLANGVTGSTTLEVNGGEINSLSFGADHYMDTHTGITIGENANVIFNGGKINGFGFQDAFKMEIMGSLNLIFNNGMTAPEKFAVPEAVGGTFTIMSDVGGKVMPTNNVGEFEIKADKGKVAMIDGKQVFDGKVTLKAGETKVTWVAGEQPVAEKTEIKLVIGSNKINTNGTDKDLDVPAQIIESRTMVPLRAIFEALGASVEWDDATKTVTSVKDDTTVKLTIGTKSITVNGEAKELDVPAQIVESRTLVPVRAIAESFGCEVGWDDATKTVTITK